MTLFTFSISHGFRAFLSFLPYNFFFNCNQLPRSLISSPSHSRIFYILFSYQRYIFSFSFRIKKKKEKTLSCTNCVCWLAPKRFVVLIWPFRAIDRVSFARSEFNPSRFLFMAANCNEYMTTNCMFPKDTNFTSIHRRREFPCTPIIPTLSLFLSIPYIAMLPLALRGIRFIYLNNSIRPRQAPA